ncbi:hypothetical protein [Sulfurimonas sp.]|uniref:hypothetical protein n=1 Tax=Sulfurimonas sp. TaxID=2022749 RepID=UPI0035617184
MLNVNDLEKRWRKYKVKSYIPHIVILISLSIIFIIISTIKDYETFDNNTIVEEKKITLTEEKENNKTKIIIDQNITEARVEKTVKEKVYENRKLVFTPSLNFMSNIKHSSISRYENDEEKLNNIYNKPKQKDIPKQKVQKHKPIELIEVIEIKEEEKKHIQIDRQNTQEDISHVIKRFKKNNNPALSLFVAKKYYELGDYHKSYNYALITNEINDNIDASWIIFSKSLVKLNEKNEAIRMLKRYIEHSHSNQAKILLEEIKSGKFK